MKKRLTALLLGFVLCLSLVGTAFASEEAFEPAEYDGKAEITAEPGGTEAVIYIEGLTPRPVRWRTAAAIGKRPSGTWRSSGTAISCG